MKKTSVYLEPEVDRALSRLAVAQGRSKAEVIREALAEKASRGAAPRITAIGALDTVGPGDVSEDVDRHLTDTGFGED